MVGTGICEYVLARSDKYAAESFLGADILSIQYEYVLFTIYKYTIAGTPYFYCSSSYPIV